MIDPRAKFEEALDAFATPGNRWGGTSALTYWGAACGMDAEAVIDAAHGAGVRSRDADIRRGMVTATARVAANAARFTGGGVVRWQNQSRTNPKQKQQTDRMSRVKQLIEDGRDIDTMEALRGLSPVQIPPATDARAYLRQTKSMLVRLFADGDIVNIRTGKADRTPATPRANLRTLADWMRQTGGHGEIVRPNPFTGKQGNTADGKPSFGAKDCIADYRHMVFEFDEMPLTDQCRFWAGFIRRGALPLVTLTYSGGKSIHGVIHVNASDAEKWAKYRTLIIERYAADSDRAYRLDIQALNPLTGCRLAGVRRSDTGKVQELLWACAEWHDKAKFKGLNPLTPPPNPNEQFAAQCDSCTAIATCKRTFGRFWSDKSSSGNGCNHPLHYEGC
ncbi:MAG: hypothetical protein IKK82_13570 [Kiritimatiellae bacterium]|nr:hypothetical protein [Kiritimatiellia bacterium]